MSSRNFLTSLFTTPESELANFLSNQTSQKALSKNTFSSRTISTTMATTLSSNSNQNTASITTTCDPVRITYLNPKFGPIEFPLANRKDVWHKFLIFHSGTPKKKEILDAIIFASSPEVLIPAFYRDESNMKSSFLAKCGFQLIDSLMKYNLQVPLPSGEYVRIDIILGYQTTSELQLNPQNVISRAAFQRYDPAKKIFNLDDFQNDKRLYPVYCCISTSKCLNLALRCARSSILSNTREMRLPVRELSMRSNDFMVFVPQEKFFNFHLTKIDFRNNKLTDFMQLSYFSEFNIMELWVDGNPLCSKYTRPDDYVKAAKAVFPHLQVLDGVMIGVEKKFVPTIQRHFLGDGSRLPLVKQFVKHYFNLYDQPDRRVLTGLYDTGAMFSMTLGSITNPIHLQMMKSFATNRNLLKFVDYAKCHEFLLHGPDDILYALIQQPKTVHNLKNSQIDLIYQSDNCFSISIQGYFIYRDYPYPPLSFARTFIIISKEDNEYCICNDQYHIESVPGDSKALQMFDIRGDLKPFPKYTPVPLSNAEREQLLRFLYELTGMNREYCIKNLEKANWDVRAAIKNFMQAYTANNVPSEAFR